MKSVPKISLEDLKNKLSPEDYNAVMDIVMTPIEDLVAEAKAEWRKKDYADIAYFKKQKTEFDKLYLKNFHKGELYRKINKLVVKDCETQIHEAEVRLGTKGDGHTSSKRDMVYRLVRKHKQEDGKT
jgi:hypothetical protein